MKNFIFLAVFTVFSIVSCTKDKLETTADFKAAQTETRALCDCSDISVSAQQNGKKTLAGCCPYRFTINLPVDACADAKIRVIISGQAPILAGSLNPTGGLVFNRTICGNQTYYLEINGLACTSPIAISCI